MPKKKQKPKKKKSHNKKSKAVSAKRASSSESENELEKKNCEAVLSGENVPNEDDIHENNREESGETSTAYPDVDYFPERLTILKQHYNNEEPEEEKEKKNFAFLLILLRNVGTVVVRRYFLSIHSGWSDTAVDATNLDRGPLKLLPHEETVFKKGDTESWDISLLIKVLRFSNKSSRILAMQPGFGDALKEVLEIRNGIIAHTRFAKLTTPEFEKHWNCLKSNLMTLGASEDEIGSSLSDYTKLVGEQQKSDFIAEFCRQEFLKEEKNKACDQEKDEKGIISPKPSFEYWDTWEKFSDCANSFDQERSHFVLLVDEMPDEHLQNFKVLSAIPWNMVLDFNPSSEDNGFHKAYTSQGSFHLLTSPWTPGQIKKITAAQLPKEINKQRTQWLFVNGKNEETEDFQPKKISEWERFSKKQISRFFACCSEDDKFDHHKSIICILLYINKKSLPYVDVTLKRFRENFEEFAITFCCFNKLLFEDLTIAQEALLEFPLTSLEVKQGVKQMFRHCDDTPSYRMPTSQAGVFINLTSRMFAYLSEHLQLFYDGCENETLDLNGEEEETQKIEKEHQLSFMSGNIISPVSLYSNHDAKREIETDIQVHITRMLSQPQTHSAIVVIKHLPGTGGSTIARRVLWDLRKYFPCVVVKFHALSDYDESDPSFIRKVCERIADLEDECGTPVLVLVDGVGRSADILGGGSRIMRTLNTSGKKSVILECLYMSHGETIEKEEGFSRKVFSVASCLKDTPADLAMFKSKYKEYVSAKDTPADLEEYISAAQTATRVFHFPLLSMIEEFRPKLVKIVEKTVDKLSDLEKEVLALVAFVHLYAGQSTPALLIYEAFKCRLAIGASTSEPVTYDKIKKQFSDELLNLMICQSPRNRAGSPSQCLEMYTLQHIEVSTLVFKKYLDDNQSLDKRRKLLMFMNWFLDIEIPNLHRFISLYCDLCLYYKAGNRDLRFSLLFYDLSKEHEQQAAKTFCKAAQIVRDPRLYGHAARYHAKMSKPNFNKAKELVKTGLEMCESKRRFQNIQDTKGVVLYIELRNKITKNKIMSIDELQQYAKVAVDAFREARDFPPTFHSPLIGEVEVWLACIGWIVKHHCDDDAEKAIKFIHCSAPPFFRTCIGDCYTLLDLVDEIIRSSESISDPEKAQEHSQRVRWDLVMTTRPKASGIQSTRLVVEDICKALLGVKKLPHNSEKQVKRYKAWTLLSLFSAQKTKPDDVSFLLRLLEEMVLIEKDHAFARHLLRVCTQISGRKSYSLDKAMDVSQVWLKAEDYDPMPCFYCMVIAFIQVTSGNGPSGFYSVYQEMFAKLREKSRFHCRRTDAILYLGKSNEGMSQLVSRATLFAGQDYQSESSEVVTNFWTKESRQKLKECVGRIRVIVKGKSEVTTVELLQGGVQLYVRKNSGLGKPGKDFDKDAKVYFVVSFSFSGPVANGLTFKPVEEN